MAIRGRVNRQDLVDQFDLVVKQEIANHNSQILATNLALDEIRKSLSAIRNDHAKHIALLENRYKKLESNYNALESSFDKLKLKTETDLDSLDNRISNEVHRLDNSFDLLEGTSVEKDEFHSVFDNIRTDLLSYQKQLDDQKIYVHNQIQSMFYQSERAVEDFKKSLLEKPSDFIEIKKELDDKIKSCMVDSEGIIRKLTVYGKGAFIMEKKIENIYHLINKLDKKVST